MRMGKRMAAAVDGGRAKAATGVPSAPRPENPPLAMPTRMTATAQAARVAGSERSICLSGPWLPGPFDDPAGPQRKPDEHRLRKHARDMIGEARAVIRLCQINRKVVDVGREDTHRIECETYGRSPADRQGSALRQANSTEQFG